MNIIQWASQISFFFCLPLESWPWIYEYLSHIIKTPSKHRKGYLKINERSITLNNIYFKFSQRKGHNEIHLLLTQSRKKNSALTKMYYIRQKVKLLQKINHFWAKKKKKENYKAWDFGKSISSDLMTIRLTNTLAVFMYERIAILIFGVSSFDGLYQG